jgi:hypothetical protein
MGVAQDPLGCICIYSLPNDTKQYINEGLQRVSTALRALECPDEYNISPKSMEHILKNTCLHVQRRIYDTHKDAAIDFDLVNRGVRLQPGERHKYRYVYHHQWSTIWKRQIELWHTTIATLLAKYCHTVEDRPHITEASHRQSLHLFCVAHLKRPRDYGSDDRLERVVVECFDTITPTQVRDSLKTIERYSAEIQKWWREYEPSSERNMQEVLCKWCLGIMFIHQAYPLKWWATFFPTLFKETKGQAVIRAELRGKPRALFLTKRLSIFPSVCRVLKIELPPEPERRVRTNKPLLEPGFQEDHAMPFVDYGEGATSSMPARLNAAKNARVIKAE